MQYDCHVTMEMQQTHCHITVPVALLWKCYKDLTCHNIYVENIESYLHIYLMSETYSK
jgi:hypothetical protein